VEDDSSICENVLLLLVTRPPPFNKRNYPVLRNVGSRVNCLFYLGGTSFRAGAMEDDRSICEKVLLLLAMRPPPPTIGTSHVLRFAGYRFNCFILPR
jgi:hypothetical protein